MYNVELNSQTYGTATIFASSDTELEDLIKFISFHSDYSIMSVERIVPQQTVKEFIEENK